MTGPFKVSHFSIVMLLLATVSRRAFSHFSLISAPCCFRLVQTIARICSRYTICVFSIGLHLLFSEDVHQYGMSRSVWQFL